MGKFQIIIWNFPNSELQEKHLHDFYSYVAIISRIIFNSTVLILFRLFYCIIYFIVLFLLYYIYYIFYSILFSFQIYTFYTCRYFIDSSKVWQKYKSFRNRYLIFDIYIYIYIYICMYVCRYTFLWITYKVIGMLIYIWLP